MIERISLITGNEGKAAEYSTLLGIDVRAVKEDLIEIQSLDVAAVVERKVADAYAKLGGPVLVDDTGLTVNAWNGLPGALVAWFLDSVGTQGILDMTANLTDRAASVTTALGYADANGIRVVTGTLRGTLATEQRGTNGFGYDEIFVPAGGVLTFAQMSAEQKNLISHRRRAVDALRAELGISGS
ncbi:non-canonical purine NTP pyrophosphatase [Pseudofrankia asymbiotica]|uniref:Non-canonical purine NTP pyrophosphatase n=1 Tax=Pseudofrankia asymbiotica TaxID=1834516 RepID=A0A1V2I0A0_9ACTN|nr:non-canonical purine NTP pyrophosphatase [Pseudofrankia asymbiotica]ONH22643.1 non-canonical purine NTP pyrophosphatase [Pseudofrankia asymbiotica]